MQEYSEAELERFGIYLLARFFLSRGDEEYMKRPIGDLVKEALADCKEKESRESEQRR